MNFAAYNDIIEKSQNGMITRGITSLEADNVKGVENRNTILLGMFYFQWLH